MISLDLKSGLPIYEQLKRNIVRLVAIGAAKGGDQLPSVRSLARSLGINPNTVQKAYQDMEKEGLILSVVGKGSFFSDRNVILEKSKSDFLGAFGKQIKEAVALKIEKAELSAVIDKVYLEVDANA